MPEVSAKKCQQTFSNSGAARCLERGRPRVEQLAHAALQRARHPDEAARVVERATQSFGTDHSVRSTANGSMESVIEVVAGVLTRADGRILACRRAPGRSAEGCWEFPGGKVEQDESPGTALARELREELAIDVIIGERIDRSVTTVDGTEIDLATYRVRWSSDGPFSSSDHDELRWLEPAELHDVRWAEPDLPTVRILQHHQFTD